MLEKSSTRNVMKQVKDDSSSLYALRDSASLLSYCTDRLSRLSMVFAFDREVLSSRIYQRVIRGSLKDSIRQRQADTRLAAQATQVQGDPDHSTPTDYKENFKELNILFIGEYEVRESILARMLTVHGPASREKCSEWRHRVKSLAKTGFMEIYHALMGNHSGFRLDHIISDDTRTLYEEMTVNPNFEIDATSAEIMRLFCQNSDLQAFLHGWMSGLKIKSWLR